VGVGNTQAGHPRFTELGSAAAVGLFLDRLPECVKNSYLFSLFPGPIFSERHQPTLPAAVTPTAARKEQGLHQKVWKLSFFLDRQII
jgi:hypothetical protein